MLAAFSQIDISCQMFFRHSSSMRKILLLAAHTSQPNRHRLDEESRDIGEGLARSRRRDDFEIVQRWAVRPRDLQRAMLEEAPQFVHFSGGDGRNAGLYFENEMGEAHWVTSEALSSLFELVASKTSVECVVMNSCYNPEQASAIAQHVPYVVGLSRPSQDSAPGSNKDANIEFAVGFYDALGNGESVEFAFKSGKVAVALSDADSHGQNPTLLKGNKPPVTYETVDKGTEATTNDTPQPQPNISQQGKYNINIGQASGLRIGDG